MKFKWVSLLAGLAFAGILYLAKAIDTRDEPPRTAASTPRSAPPPLALDVVVPPALAALAERSPDEVEHVLVTASMQGVDNRLQPLATARAIVCARIGDELTLALSMDDASRWRIGPFSAELTPGAVTPLATKWPALIAVAAARPALQGPRDSVLEVPMVLTARTSGSRSGILSLRTDRAVRVLLDVAKGGVHFPDDAAARVPRALAYLSRSGSAFNRIRGKAESVRDIDLVAIDEGQPRDLGPCPANQSQLSATDADVRVYDRRTGALRAERLFVAATPVCDHGAFGDTTRADPNEVDRWLDTVLQPPVADTLAPPTEWLGGEETSAITAHWKVFGLPAGKAARILVKKLGTPGRQEMIDGELSVAYADGAIVMTLKGANGDALDSPSMVRGATCSPMRGCVIPRAMRSVCRSKRSRSATASHRAWSGTVCTTTVHAATSAWSSRSSSSPVVPGRYDASASCGVADTLGPGARTPRGRHPELAAVLRTRTLSAPTRNQR